MKTYTIDFGQILSFLVAIWTANMAAHVAQSGNWGAAAGWFVVVVYLVVHPFEFSIKWER